MASTFETLKGKVSIIAVAKELGYVYDRKEGTAQPHFLLKDVNGMIADDINIKNPGDSMKQGFWRRHPAPGRKQKGDIIDFIRENKTAFDEYAVSRNDWDLVNRVLARMANEDRSMSDVLKTSMGIIELSHKDFNLDRWERTIGPDSSGEAILRHRGFGPEAIEMFRSSIEMVRHKESKNRFINIGFPFRIPGDINIKGYEIRGFGTFKTKAQGTDSQNASWQGYAGSGSLQQSIRNIRHVHLAESAYDAMSYAVINKTALNLDECVFCSMGGQFSDAQVENLLKTFKGAMLHLHFDNDSAGQAMECRAIALANGHRLKISPKTDSTEYSFADRSVIIPAEKNDTEEFCKLSGLSTALVKIERAPYPHKDWNEVLMNATARKSSKDISDIEHERVEKRNTRLKI